MNNQQLITQCREILAEPENHTEWCVEITRLALERLEAEPPVPALRPVDLRATLNPEMFNADVIFGYSKARAEDIVAIRAAGYEVKS